MNRIYKAAILAVVLSIPAAPAFADREVRHVMGHGRSSDFRRHEPVHYQKYYHHYPRFYRASRPCAAAPVQRVAYYYRGGVYYLLTPAGYVPAGSSSYIIVENYAPYSTVSW